MDNETKIEAVLNYGEKLILKESNAELLREIKSYIQSIIIVVMILLYFRHIILENPNNFLKNSNKKRKKYYNIQERFISHPVIPQPIYNRREPFYNRRESFNNSNNMRFLH